MKDSKKTVFDGMTSSENEPNNRVENNTTSEKSFTDHNQTLLECLIKKDKSTGLEMIYAKDGKTAFNLHECCPPMPHCEKLGKVKPRRQVIVCPARTTGYVARNAIHVPDGGDSGYVGGGYTDSRKRFLIHMFIILGIQLLATFLFDFLCVYVEAVGNFVRVTSALLYCVIALDIILFFLLSCVEAARTSYPINYVILGTITLCSAYCWGYLCSLSDSDKPILVSFCTTMVIIGLILLVSLIGLCDITAWFFVIDILFLSSMIFYLVAMIYFWATDGVLLLYIFYCVILTVVVLSLFHLVQLVFGKGKYSMEAEENILAAIVMYIHITLIFITLPRIILGPPPF